MLLGRLGERHIDVRVAAFADRKFTGRLEELERVLADELVAGEARFAVVGRDDPDKTLLGQRFEPAEGVDIDCIGVGDRLGSVRGPAAAEDTEASEQGLLIGIEEIDAPRDRTADGPLSFGEVARARAQEIEASLEPFEDPRRREQTDPAPPRARPRGAGLRVEPRSLRRPAG